MKVLFTFGASACSHDYLNGFLFSGFKSIFGLGDAVVESPPAHWLHLASEEDRDACELDCDMFYLTAGELFGRAVDRFRNRDFDLVVAKFSAFEDGTLQKIVGDNEHGVPLALCYGLDEVRPVMPEIRERLPKGTVFFQREVPIGAMPREDWGIPLPFCYPAGRAVAPSADRRGAIYWTTTHDGTATMRNDIVCDLVRGGLTNVLATPKQQPRPLPEAYHKILAKHLVGVHWSPPRTGLDHGYFSNRLFENAAYGLVQVAQRPFVEFPNAFEDGKHIVYVDEPAQVASAVAKLLAEPERALEMAQTSFEHFKTFHSARARAEYLLRHCGFGNF